MFLLEGISHSKDSDGANGAQIQEVVGFSKIGDAQKQEILVSRVREVIGIEIKVDFDF